MRKLFLLLLCFFYLFAFQQKFLESQEAFEKKIEKKRDKLVFSIKFGKDIYLYDNKLKFFIIKPSKINIKENLNIPKPKPYKKWQVYTRDLNIEIPYSLLKSKVGNVSNMEIQIQFQGCSKQGFCYPPVRETKIINLNDFSNTKAKVENTSSKSETNLIVRSLEEGNIFLILASFLGFGLLLSLTPCVFPMIPILSSLIIKAGNSGNLSALRGFFLSLVYVLSMAVTYTIVGVLAGLFGSNLQIAFQNPYILVIFALIFVALAFSMFGYFKLELPQSLQTKINKITNQKSKQGVVGISVMGFLSALIVGPCVAPPLAAALIYIGQTGDAFLGAIALFSMGIGMGLPLLLVGLGTRRYMPKSGPWMDSISKIFGIVMLGLAIWILNRVLMPNITIYLWALLLIGTGLYLKIFEHIIGRLVSIMILIYGILLFVAAISGATNPLKPLNKFISNSTKNHFQHGLIWVKAKTNEQLDRILKNSSKPVMLDFYAKWCISCKELETITFEDEMVIEKLKDFTLIKIDVTENNPYDKAMQKRFRVIGPPALIFFDRNNNEIKAARIIGYKNTKDFLEIVNKYY